MTFFLFALVGLFRACVHLISEFLPATVAERVTLTIHMLRFVFLASVFKGDNATV